ncbi:response regulator [Leptolyngbya sp. BC1307]|uniref:response regulator n=1 Tax=Leptolyngbya sp. BC1307 TaxID=2029589 RepID=UPI000EFCD308|nr:response regulator [Leptolyngbya sp. BC1307]
MLPEQQQRIMGYFIEEAKDHLNTIEQGLLSLQLTIEDTEKANEVFRAAHSVKGGAAMLGLESIQKTAHRLEDYFKILKESPVQVDRTLETMFLRVSDGLKDLLEQLEGPFGLTADKAHEIMAGVEPVFDQLEQHLDALIEESDVDTGGEMIAPVAFTYGDVSAADISPDDFSSRFQREVALLLRQMLTTFKQPDTAASRKVLQDVCAHLSAIGEQFDLPAWCDLIETARLAAANLDNDYRTLAPVLIKDIKKSQDLVLSGQAAEIAVSDTMQSLLPEDALFAGLDASELENDDASDDLDGLGFNIADTGNADEITQELEDLSLNGYSSAEADVPVALSGLDEEPLDAYLEAGDDAEDDLDSLFDRDSEEESLFDDALADSSDNDLVELADPQALVAIAPDAEAPAADDIGRLSVDLEFDEVPLELSTLNRQFDSEGRADESLDALMATVNVTGPDVGTEELNSLADLFDGDLDELDNTLGGHPFATVEMQLNPENIDLAEADDLTDLLAGDIPDDTDDIAREIAESDEIADDLFGGTLTGGEFATMDESDLDDLDGLAAAADELNGATTEADLGALADTSLAESTSAPTEASVFDTPIPDPLTSDMPGDITADMAALSEDVWADDMFDSAEELFDSVEDDLLGANGLAETVGLADVAAEDLPDQLDEAGLGFSEVEQPDAELAADAVETPAEEKQIVSDEAIAPAPTSANLPARAVAAPRQTGPNFHLLTGEALQEAEKDIDSFFLGDAASKAVERLEERRSAPLEVERSRDPEEQPADDSWGELAALSDADEETDEEIDWADSTIDDLDNPAPVDNSTGTEEDLLDLEMSFDEQSFDEPLSIEMGFTDEDASLDLEALLESEPSDAALEDLFDAPTDTAAFSDSNDLSAEATDGSEAEDLLDFGSLEGDAEETSLEEASLEETSLESTDESNADSDELILDWETSESDAGEDKLSEIEGFEIEGTAGDFAEESLRHSADESSDDAVENLESMLLEETVEADDTSDADEETDEEIDWADLTIGDLDNPAPVDNSTGTEKDLLDLEMSFGDEQDASLEDASLDLEALLESEPSDVALLEEASLEETSLESTDESHADSDELILDWETSESDAGEDELSEIEGLEIEGTAGDFAEESLRHSADESSDDVAENLESMLLEETIEADETSDEATGDDFDDFAEESLHHSADESSDDDFDDLDSLLSEETLEADGTSDEATGDDFDDLDLLLSEETVEESAPSNAAGPLLTADMETPTLGGAVSADADDFGDLERLLEDRVEGSASVLPRSMPPRLARRGSGLREQNMRVSVNHLDNLSNFVGELVVSRNTLERDQERLRQFLDNLLFQVQQLNDVGQRMRDLYERSLLESSLMSNRRAYSSANSRDRDKEKESTAGHATGATFDALEMDRFTGFHTLSQEMIELIVRVRESSSDIGYTVESSDQVTRQFRQITTQLQEGLNTARMVAFSQAADRLPRAVRDISLKCGKEARLVVEGQDTLIDKMIVEHLYDPLTHLVNNAITHGIETPAARRAAGKPSEGTITVRAFYQGNQTVIYVADNGGGIDTELVKRKAIEQALISPTEAEGLSAIETYELLFHPGFTTRDQADDFAGRGVGMDVVRTSLAEIRGSVTIDSEQGKGTSFTIRLPLTLSISKALSCVSNQARIAFPMDGVEDMLDVPRDRIVKNDQDQDCVRWRDTLLPFQPITDLLKFNRTLGRGRVYGGGQDEDVLSIIVLRSANTFVAVQVDQVIGEQEIVIKQLEGPVPKPLGIAGATVLGDGRVMPIADVLELIDIATGRIRREPASLMWAQEPVTEAPVKRDPTVLIVDDSITVRELLSMSFSKIGYRVEQARDGQEAWDKLRSGLPCDLVFCDIEMPRMDGLELLSRMQKDGQLKRIPIAMLTSRGADRHRQMAVDLGASGYFTKPYLEEALLDAAQRMLNGETLAKGRGG